ncbi:MAG: acyl-CoA dehydrogenase family protein, partial [Acidimicrobiales bacterium]
EAVLLPPAGHGDPPGSLQGGRLRARGLGTARLATAGRVLVAADLAGRTVVVAVDAGRLDDRRPVQGMDPRMGLVEATGTAIPVGTAEVVEAPWPAAAGRARLALAHELVGASRAMLELARVHALERKQFGRPIAAFQAVRHRLADALVAIEAAEAAVDAAWEDPWAGAPAAAKAVAGRAAATVARHAQQVLAGIGFTTEHPFHRYARRALVLDQLFGSAGGLTRALGRELLHDRRLPAPPAL